MGRTLFLHIGLQKTGTTTIQTFLTRNRALLVQHGFVYPDPATVRFGLDDHNHGHLALSLTGYWRDPGYQLNRKEAWGELRDCYFNSEGKLLVSTELLSTPQIVPHVRFIKKMLRGIEVKVVIYLRRQDIFVQSVHKERLKDTESRSFQQAVEQGDYPRILDFQTILQCWKKHFGVNNIIVRPFEKRQLVNGDALDDFLHITGIDRINGLEKPTRHENKAMSRDVLEISRALNMLGVEGKHIPSFKWWLNEVIGGSEGKTFTDHSIISPKERLAILNRYAEGNECIAREFLGRADGRLFLEDLPDIDETWQAYGGVPPERVARILLAMIDKYSLLRDSEQDIES